MARRTPNRPSSGSGRRFFQARVVVLLCVLLAVAIWRARIIVDENRTVDWTTYHQVLICPLVTTGADFQHLRAEFTATETALGAWLASEFEHWTRSDAVPVLFRFADPIAVTGEPPPLPAADASFLDRWRGVHGFLGWFGRHERDFPAPWPNATRIYLFVYPEARRPEFEDRHSVGTRRGRLGVVFASDATERWGNAQSVIVHEMLHTVGAKEHRDESGTIAHPDGYADPDAVPLHPQTQAEIMALGIPSTANDEYLVRSLDDVVLGRKTASEIGWLGDQSD